MMSWNVTGNSSVATTTPSAKVLSQKVASESQEESLLNKPSKPSGFETASASTSGSIFDQEGLDAPEPKFATGEIFKAKNDKGEVQQYLGGGKIKLPNGEVKQETFGAHIEKNLGGIPLEDRIYPSYTDDVEQNIIIVTNNITKRGFKLKDLEIDILKSTGATDEQIQELKSLPVAKEASTQHIATATTGEDSAEKGSAGRVW